MRIIHLWLAILLLGCDEERKCQPQDRAIGDPDEVLAIGWEDESRKPLVWLTTREAVLQSERREVCLDMVSYHGDEQDPVRVHLEVPAIDIETIDADWRLTCAYSGRGGNRTLTLGYVWGILRTSQRSAGAIAVQGDLLITVEEGATRGQFQATLGCDVWAAPPCVDQMGEVDISMHVWDYEDDDLYSFWYRYDAITGWDDALEGYEVLPPDECAGLIEAAPFDSSTLR